MIKEIQELEDLFDNGLIATLKDKDPSVDVFIGYVTSGMIAMIVGEENKKRLFKLWQKAQDIIFIRKQKYLEKRLEEEK